MMKTYLNISGRTEDACQLEELCDRLKQVSTREDVDHVNQMLSNFASLTIEKKGNVSWVFAHLTIEKKGNVTIRKERKCYNKKRKEILQLEKKEMLRETLHVLQ